MDGHGPHSLFGGVVEPDLPRPAMHAGLTKPATRTCCWRPQSSFRGLPFGYEAGECQPRQQHLQEPAEHVRKGVFVAVKAPAIPAGPHLRQHIGIHRIGNTWRSSCTINALLLGGASLEGTWHCHWVRGAILSRKILMITLENWKWQNWQQRLCQRLATLPLVFTVCAVNL